MKKKMRKIFAVIMTAVMVVTLSTCAFASEGYDQGTVKEVQQALNDAGFSCGTPDGVAGNNTRKAISDFQESKGLEVTGEINEELLAALFPAEPKEAETVAEVTTDADISDETKEVAASEEKSEESGEALYTMASGDYMAYTFEDGYDYRISINEGTANFEKVKDGQVIPEEFSHGTADEYKIGLINYIVEKYFYAARASVEDLPVRENVLYDFPKGEESTAKVALPQQTLDYLSPEELEALHNANQTGSAEPDEFEWIPEKRLTYTFSDGPIYRIYYENDTLKIGLENEGGLEEIRVFEDAEKKEIGKFIDYLFVSERMDADHEYNMSVKFPGW